MMWQGGRAIATRRRALAAGSALIAAAAVVVPVTASAARIGPAAPGVGQRVGHGGVTALIVRDHYGRCSVAG